MNNVEETAAPSASIQHAHNLDGVADFFDNNEETGHVDLLLLSMR